MATRRVSRRRLKVHAIGDMTSRIVLFKRSLTAPVFGTAKATEDYSSGTRTWAKVTTLDTISAGKQLFDKVDPKNQPSHMFSIRFRKFLTDGSTPITSQVAIRWEGNSYRIVSIHDPEERHQFLELFARLLGDQAKEANQ